MTGAMEILRLMERNRNRLTGQQMRTMKGQALSGDVTGARKGLERILRGEERDHGNHHGDPQGGV